MIRPAVGALVSMLTTCPGNGDGDNRPPVVHDISLSAVEDMPLIVSRELLDISDPDGDLLQFRLLPPAHGVLDGTGPWTYTPAQNYVGRDSIRLEVTDGELGAAGTLWVDVAAVD